VTSLLNGVFDSWAVAHGTTSISASYLAESCVAVFQVLEK